MRSDQALAAAAANRAMVAALGTSATDAAGATAAAATATKAAFSEEDDFHNRGESQRRWRRISAQIEIPGGNLRSESQVEIPG